MARLKTDPVHVDIDAGVIFGDRSSYLCLPLSRVGVVSSADIESLGSSCDCIKPFLDRYSETSATIADGLLIEFVADEPGPDTTLQPMQLSIDVKLRLVGGKSRTVTVNFLHAPLLKAGEP